MQSFKQIFEIGTHIISLPIDRNYKLDELFDTSLTGSYIEKLDENGNFINKEKILFENNQFSVSENYKELVPFQTIRLTIRRKTEVNWKFSFKSDSFVKNNEMIINQGYDKNKVFHLMQLCDLIYEKESIIEKKILEHYKFDNYLYFSKQSHKLMKKNFFKLVFTALKSKTKIVDLQFMKLNKYDETLKKEIITLIFKGSKEAEDWMTNIGLKRATFFGKEEVHKGFYESLKLFLTTMKNEDFAKKEDKNIRFHDDIDYINENCQIILAGHSLGGAIATLAGCYFTDLGIKKENLNIYTFGAPPVGCDEFSQNYGKRVELYRIVNENDIVPKIDKITNLRHFGKEIILESNDNEIHSCDNYIDNLIDDLYSKES